MLVSEFEKRIKNIDNHLYAAKQKEYPNIIIVNYSLADDSCLPVVGIGKYGFINTCNSGFEFLSNKKRRKLLLDCVDIALTPLDERVEHKWQAKVAEHGKTEVKSEDGEEKIGSIKEDK